VEPVFLTNKSGLISLAVLISCAAKQQDLANVIRPAGTVPYQGDINIIYSFLAIYRFSLEFKTYQKQKSQCYQHWLYYF